MTATGKGTLTRAAAAHFEERGFTVVPGLSGYDEIARLCAEFAALHTAGPVPGHFAPDAAGLDPLRRHPRVVHPHENRTDLFCPEVADAGLSFAREYVPPSPGLEPMPVDLAPGDVLFFNGSLVHGSGPDRSAGRFRRPFIGRYVGRSAWRIGAHYRTLTMSGARARVRAARSSRRTDRTGFDRAGLSDR